MVLFAALALAASGPILAVDGYLVGYRTKAGWKPADEAYVKRHPRLEFRPFGLGTAGGVPERAKVGWDEQQSGSTLSIEAREPLLAGAVPRAPRRVRVLPPSPAYEAAARRFLGLHGIKVAQARVTRVLRVDLDGDGTDETLVEATNGEVANSAPAGAYSLVLLRALRGGRVVETALEFTPAIQGGVLDSAQVRGIADLDGDGRMEVLTTVSGIDDEGARLWGYRTGRASMLVENGIGV